MCLNVDLSVVVSVILIVPVVLVIHAIVVMAAAINIGKSLRSTAIVGKRSFDLYISCGGISRTCIDGRS